MSDVTDATEFFKAPVITNFMKSHLSKTKNLFKSF